MLRHTDDLWGGQGSDTFVFWAHANDTANGDLDTAHDLDAGNTLVFRGVSVSNLRVEHLGGDTMLTYQDEGADNTWGGADDLYGMVYLKGVTQAEFAAVDIEFLSAGQSLMSYSTFAHTSATLSNQGHDWLA